MKVSGWKYLAKTQVLMLLLPERGHMLGARAYGAYNVTVSMYRISWAPGGLPSYYEYTPGYLNFTADINGSGKSVPVQNVDDSHAITVKASSCFLYFHIESNVPSGWIYLYVTPYLRNE